MRKFTLKCLCRIGSRFFLLIRKKLRKDWKEANSELKRTNSFALVNKQSKCLVEKNFSKKKHFYQFGFKALSPSYGSNFPTSLTYIILLTKGCSPRRRSDSAVTSPGFSGSRPRGHLCMLRELRHSSHEAKTHSPCNPWHGKLLSIPKSRGLLVSGC